MQKSGLEPIRQFYMTAISGPIVGPLPLIDYINDIENLLVQNINLKNYGQALDDIGFIYIITSSKNEIHKESKTYFKSKKNVLMQLKINEEDFIVASEENALSMMAELFLKSILLYKDMKIKDFNYLRFYDDVKKLFISKKLMVGEGEVAEVK